MAKFKKINKNKSEFIHGKKGQLYSLLVRVTPGADTMEKSMKFFQKLEIDLLYDPALPLLRHITKVHIILQKIDCSSSVLFYSQHLRNRNRLDIHQSVNG